jgi:hypothetical protein
MEEQKKTKKEKWQNLGLSVFLWIMPLILLFALVVLWPVGDDGTGNKDQNQQKGNQNQETISVAALSEPAGNDTSTETTVGEINSERPQIQWSKTTNIFNWGIGFELRLLLLVLLAGGLGSSIHAASSFSYHKGSRSFDITFLSWYLMRIPVGAGLALVIILLIKGNIFVPPNNLSDINPFGTMGMAALTGLFSKQALSKLSDIFDTMFTSSKNEITTKPGSGATPGNQ